jgi:transposase
MDRSMIYYLRDRGWSKTQIASFVGHHRDTIARVLHEPVDQQPAARPRTPLAAAFAEQVERWLDEGLNVRRMIELARADSDHPFTGSDVAFYKFVRPLRLARRALPAHVVVRFEGLPGELLQIDWGEQRRMKFTKPALAGQTRYFFAARLKYSRWMWARFTTDMQSETLLRCLIGCLVALGGVPWVVTSDNPKTITLGRDAQQQPILHPAYQQVAIEFGFHPALCAPAAAQQKGAVENLVKFVKSNFLAGRHFYDDADLARDCADWLRRVNEERPSDATEQLPVVLLEAERPHFKPLPRSAQDYGLFDSVLVSRESLVTIATNRYSVPVAYVGQALTARLHPDRIALYDGATLVASHPRCSERRQRIVDPAHYEPVFAHKPRARTMVYRDWLVARGPSVAAYVQRLCQRRYHEMDQQIAALYTLARQLGDEGFARVVTWALAQDAIGVEYLHAAPASPAPPPSSRPALQLLGPAQREVERELAAYEAYVANGAALLDAPAQHTGLGTALLAQGAGR